MSVSLTSQNLVFNELKKSIKEKHKLVLLVGKSGLGKSFLLEKLCQDKKLILFSKPFFDENTFVKALFDECFKEKAGFGFESLYKEFKLNTMQDYVFLLDEVGMYEESLLEKVRILSDLANISFILALHKKQEIFSKEYFASRISKEILLKSLGVEELSFYAKEKFDLHLDKRHLKWLLKISASNLRLIDRVFTTYAKLYSFYEREKHKKSPKNILQMSAFYHNLLGK